MRECGEHIKGHSTDAMEDQELVCVREGNARTVEKVYSEKITKEAQAMKARIGGQTVDLEIEGRVRQNGRDLTVSRTGCEGMTTHRHAVAPLSPYRSKLEAQYAQHLDLMKRAGEIVAWWYEPIRFRLPGTRNYYKADFLIQNGCKPLKGSMAGQHAGIEIHEVKGWSKNRREGITKLKAAAGLNQWASFYLVRWDEDQQQWDKQLVQV